MSIKHVTHLDHLWVAGAGGWCVRELRTLRLAQKRWDGEEQSIVGLNEAETRVQLIDPAIHARGWTEDLIRREETLGGGDRLLRRHRARSRGRSG